MNVSDALSMGRPAATAAAYCGERMSAFQALATAARALACASAATPVTPLARASATASETSVRCGALLHGGQVALLELSQLRCARVHGRLELGGVQLLGAREVRVHAPVHRGQELGREVLL